MKRLQSVMRGLVWLVAAGCSAGEAPTVVTPPTVPVDPNVVGATGGTVTAEGGAVTLQLPAGAVSASTRIAVTPRTDVSTNPNVGAAWEFGPSGTQFSAPVTMRLRYPANAFASDVDLTRLTIARLENGEWVPRAENVSVDPATREVRGEVRSFSTWGVFSDPCAPGVLGFGASFTGAGTLNEFGCRFVSGATSRWSRYWEFEVTAQSTFEWRVRPDFPHVIGIKQATAVTSEGTVWGSAAGNAGDSTVLRAVLAPARYQLFVSTRDTSARGPFTFAGGTPSIPALTSGLGCSRATWLVPGTRVVGAVLDSAAGDCRTTIQFSPFPDVIGKPLVMDYYQARLLAGRTYTITYTLPSREAYGGAALTVYRNGLVGQDLQDQSRLVRTVQVTPPSDGNYLIEPSANGSPANNWALPAPFAYEIAVSDGGAPVSATVGLSRDTVRLGAADDTVRLVATVRRNGAVVNGAVPSWRSSNPSVATISSAGVITARARGSATITATWGTGEAQATVTVDPRGYATAALAAVQRTFDTPEVRTDMSGVDAAMQQRNRERAAAFLADASTRLASFSDAELATMAQLVSRYGLAAPGFGSEPPVQPAACFDGGAAGTCTPLPAGCADGRRVDRTRSQYINCVLVVRALAGRQNAEFFRRVGDIETASSIEESEAAANRPIARVYRLIREMVASEAYKAIRGRPAPAGQVPVVNKAIKTRSAAFTIRGLRKAGISGSTVTQASETPFVITSGTAQPLQLAITSRNPLPSDVGVPVATELLSEYARLDTLWRTLATKARMAFEPEIPNAPMTTVDSLVTGALLEEVRVVSVSRPGVTAQLVDLGTDIGLRLTGPSSQGAVFTVTLETTNAEYGIVRTDVPVILRAGTPRIEAAWVDSWTAINQSAQCNASFPQGTNGVARVRIRLSEPIPPGRGLRVRTLWTGGSNAYSLVPLSVLRQVGDRVYEHEAGFCWGGPTGNLDYEMQFEDEDGTRSNVFLLRLPRP